MQRALAKAGEKSDRQQVEKPLEEPREAILGNAVPPAAVPNVDFRDPKAASVSQDRDKPVQLAIDADLPQDLFPVNLEPAIMIVQATATHSADHPVEEAAGVNFVPRIMADFFHPLTTS